MNMEGPGETAWLHKHSGPSLHAYEAKGEVVAPWNRFKPSSKIFILTVPRLCFFCGSFMLFLPCSCCAFVRVCSLMPCGHLLGKGWPLGSHMWCLIVKLSLSHCYPGSGVVLDCIDSWSLPSFLLCSQTIETIDILSNWLNSILNKVHIH